MGRAEQVAWLAGLLEGEGCFTAARGWAGRNRTDWYDVPVVQLVMCDKDVVEKANRTVVEIFGWGPRPVSANPRKNAPAHWRVPYRLTWRRDKAMAIMRLVRPFVGVRRGQRIDELLSKYGPQEQLALLA